MSLEASAVRTPMTARDDRLLRNGVMRDSRGEYLTLRMLVLGPEGVRVRVRVREESESERRRGKVTEQWRERMEINGRRDSVNKSESVGGGRRATREEKDLALR
jgi:predicted Holliday junction resolvase-like endonuclease